MTGRNRRCDRDIDELLAIRTHLSHRLAPTRDARTLYVVGARRQLQLGDHPQDVGEQFEVMATSAIWSAT
jgi:hypothetical protein